MNLKTKKETLEQYDYATEDETFNPYNYYSYHIGLFLIAFSELEHCIETHLAELIHSGTHQPGFTLIQLIKDFKNKVYLLIRNIQPAIGNDNTKKNKLKLIQGELNDLNQLRNIICHAKWYLARKDKSVRVKIEYDKDGWIEFKNYYITKRDISKRITRIKKLILEIDNFTENLF
jgi:hypothetical protein